MNDRNASIARRGVELLTAQVTELARFRDLLDGEDTAARVDVDLLGPFLDETDDLVASLLTRQARLDEIANLHPAGPEPWAEEAEIHRLRDIMDAEVRGIRTGMVRFARDLTVRAVAVATELDALRAAKQRQPEPRGATPRGTMVDTVV